MSLAQDTVLTPAGPGRWRATYHDGWEVVRGPFGGWIAALLARALGEVTAWPPRTLAIHFVDAPAPGEVEVTAEVVREGRSSSAVSLAVEQGGRPMARALSTAGKWRGEEEAWSGLEPPRAPAPEDCARVEGGEGWPNFLEQLDIRWVAGHPPVPPGGEAHNVTWVSAGPLDVPAVAALSDLMMPPAFSRLGRPAIVPTLDMTVHFRAPVPAGETWVLCEHRSHHAAGGTWTCDGELWTPDGRLLAQVRQLAMLRT